MLCSSGGSHQPAVLHMYVQASLVGRRFQRDHKTLGVEISPHETARHHPPPLDPVAHGARRSEKYYPLSRLV